VLKLVLLFTLVPLAELALLILIGDRIGVLPTIAIVVVTGATGAWLAKHEGLRVWRQWQECLAQGRTPDEGIIGGLLVLVGGILLLTPGVLTDLAGILLLVPQTRRLVADRVRRAIQKRIESGRIRMVHVSGPTGFDPFRPGGTVIDAEAEVVPRPRPDAHEAAEG